ncbi:26S proteasome subunit RPN7-domain-containing protein [Syncephalis fuscata]|nr:26S proteasome subunit RPN7-domain-containing protein [Syncephalis fuscata]
MAPFYRLLSEELGWTVDDALLSQMEAANIEELKALDVKLEDAEQNLGETDISDALIAKAQYLAQIGEKDKAINAYRVAFDKTAPLGHRLDILFAQIRIGIFHQDPEVTSRYIEQAKLLIEEGGDWDRRNRLKAYEGTYLMSIRDFKGAATLFLDTISTFTSTELMSYCDFVKYAVLTATISLERLEIKKKVIDAPEILEVINDLPNLEDYMTSLHACEYAKFFQSLAAVEQSYIKTSVFLYPHRTYYVREMRIHAYAQLLESYRSLTLSSMATSFGVSEEFIDRELSRFISLGRLHCVIDKVNGIVETNRPDAKNAQYQTCIKQGDILLNRIQKLSRVINV